MSRFKCRHCGGGPVNRPRGLCWTCYYRPGVKDRYAVTSKFARRGIKDSHKSRETPQTPTEAPAGSEEKIAVLEARAREGLNLWHPDDNLTRIERKTKDEGRHWRKTHARTD